VTSSSPAGQVRENRGGRVLVDHTRAADKQETAYSRASPARRREQPGGGEGGRPDQAGGGHGAAAAGRGGVNGRDVHLRIDNAFCASSL
jgi:uncharacterized membrane protein